MLLVGLANGSYLWEAMHDRYHPLGRLRKDLKYEDAYRWLNCIQVGNMNLVSVRDHVVMMWPGAGT